MLKKFEIIRGNESKIAQNIVDHIFEHIRVCLREDRSRKQLSLFAKSFIGGILNQKTLGGINDFIDGMNDEDLNSLLDDIQKELNKRRFKESSL